eukprot:scaffold353_cov185-Amphora_coffeaeformis.AAC.18
MGEEQQRQVKMERLEEEETARHAPVPTVRKQFLLEEFMMQMRQKARTGEMSQGNNHAWRSPFAHHTSSAGSPTNAPEPRQPEDLRVPIGRMGEEPHMVHLAQ